MDMPISLTKLISAGATAVTLAAATAATAQTHDVVIFDDAFFPAVIYVDAGDELRFLNNASAARNVSAGDGSWSSGTLETGSSFSQMVEANSQVTFIGTSLGENPKSYSGEISFDPAPLSE
ncbi:hypothetical protein GLP43_13490 [Sulfitobacter sp. M39]|nr:hypothetical protein [Sulfitobacter sp. M39]